MDTDLFDTDVGVNSNPDMHRVTCATSRIFCDIRFAALFLASANMADQTADEELPQNDLSELALACGIPQPVVDKIMTDGYDCPALFRACFHTAESLDRKLKQWLESEIDTDSDEFLTAPITGRIRMLWMKCFDESSQDKSDPTPATDPLTDRLAWTDLPPPKLSPVAITKLKAKFKTDYPGELLNQQTCPCARLLSQVAEQCKKDNTFEWISWKNILSEDQWSKQQEAKSAKAFKPGAALLASAIVEDTPQMLENETQGSPLQIAKVLEIRRNAYVLQGVAHLGPWKALDAKMLDLYTTRYGEQSGLRPPNIQEFISADRKIWEGIFQLDNEESWELDNAILEFCHARADIPTLLMARPRALKGKSKGVGKYRYEPYGKGKGKYDKGKGKFKGGKGKNHPPQNWAKSFADSSGAQNEFCFRFHTSECSFKNCKFALIFAQS